ncbi:MAG: hypothetical protein A2W25_15110 [candidate division Zixibacteria bacterium RBG_16_53_22]|nr:MAG: hypothetical protein A2W25_15110 [candidate division Zixibacteria bacterium RBG_16_53_22]
MLATLKLVRGATSDKGIIPAMSHFFIYQGRIQSTNGRISIDAPCEQLKDYSLTVPADKFIKAIDGMDAEPVITISETRVTLAEGSLKVRLPILANDAFPRTEPEGDAFAPETPLLPVLRVLRPYISSDASKPWSTGLLLTDRGDALATNNVIMVKMPCDLLGDTGFNINLPITAVEELLRIGEEPTGFGIREDAGSITFHYASGLWLKCSLLQNDWPTESVGKLFAGIKPKTLVAVPKGLKDAIKRILPFCPDEKFPMVQLNEQGISTAEGDQSAEVAGIKLPQGKFNGNMLLLVLDAAKKFALHEDAPSYFSGEGGLLGVFVGVKI